MTRVRRWGTFALMGLAMGAVCTAGGTRSWADDEATNQQEVTKPDTGSQDEKGTDTTQSSDDAQAPATDNKDQ